MTQPKRKPLSIDLATRKLLEEATALTQAGQDRKVYMSDTIFYALKKQIKDPSIA